MNLISGVIHKFSEKRKVIHRGLPDLRCGNVDSSQNILKLNFYFERTLWKTLWIEKRRPNLSTLNPQSYPQDFHKKRVPDSFPFFYLSTQALQTVSTHLKGGLRRKKLVVKWELLTRLPYELEASFN